MRRSPPAHRRRGLRWLPDGPSSNGEASSGPPVNQQQASARSATDSSLCCTRRAGRPNVDTHNHDYASGSFDTAPHAVIRQLDALPTPQTSRGTSQFTQSRIRQLIGASRSAERESDQRLTGPVVPVGMSTWTGRQRRPERRRPGDDGRPAGPLGGAEADRLSAAPGGEDVVSAPVDCRRSRRSSSQPPAGRRSGCRPRRSLSCSGPGSGSSARQRRRARTGPWYSGC